VGKSNHPWGQGSNKQHRNTDRRGLLPERKKASRKANVCPPEKKTSAQNLEEGDKGRGQANRDLWLAIERVDGILLPEKKSSLGEKESIVEGKER